MQPKRKLYLASGSPRRVQLLTDFNIPFEIIPNLLKEEYLPEKSDDITFFLEKLAFEKADASKCDYKGLILSVDTTVIKDDCVLTKPKDLSEAKKMLKALSNKKHQVISGYCLLDTLSNTKFCETVISTVYFKPLSNNIIDYYTHNFVVLDKAGSYGIQDYAKNFVSKIEGSYYNIVGLPIEAIKKQLAKYSLGKVTHQNQGV